MFEARAAQLEVAVTRAEPMPVAPLVVDELAVVPAALEPSTKGLEPQEASLTNAAAIQLSLFAEDSSNSDKGKKKLETRGQQVVDQLKGLDLINMTPLQALNIIYELKQKLQSS
ncbi:hypothetical protein D3C73_1239620 [compost metagenome]